MELVMSETASPLGRLLLISDRADKLMALEFADREARLRRWLDRHARFATLVRGPAPPAIAQALAAYFAGDLRAIDVLQVGSTGTPFQQQCWNALRSIAPGTTSTYARQAAAIGAPRAARAVGRANAGNPIAIVVPCHRVIGADASLAGYAGGGERKAWLLAHEASYRRRADREPTTLLEMT